MTQPDLQAAWETYCVRVATPTLANGCPRFAQFGHVEQVSLACHWTDVHWLDDLDGRVDAESGIPSTFAIRFAGEHGVNETELREAYAALARLQGDGPAGGVRGVH